MERIAIPVSGTRVSPLFDMAARMLVADVEGGQSLSREELPLWNGFPAGQVQALRDARVGTLVCGGITRNMEMLVRSQGIRVMPWVAGEAEEVLAAFLQGGLTSRQFAMPGCCGRRRRRGGGGRGRRAYR